MSEYDRPEKSSLVYSWGEMFFLAATGVVPGMIILWAYKKFVKKEE